VLTVLVAHAGQAVQPHDLWTAWNLHPVVLGSLVALAWCFHRGRRAARNGTARSRTGGARRWRERCFVAALATFGVALVSPLDALSGALASAHMVQHVLLVLVAAPLLALAAPGARLLRGSPPALRAALLRARAGRTSARLLDLAHHPVIAWLAHVGVLWFWHAAGPYDAALSHDALHVLEHATFVGTGVLFWGVVLGGRRAGRMPAGAAILLLFTMALQSVFLSALITFAPTPWYRSFAGTTRAWGLEPLADQQLAGAIMWIPAGMVYVAAGLALLVAALRTLEQLDRRLPSSGGGGGDTR
jgi:cytochrome c oxidase assembly factor CtaG